MTAAFRLPPDDSWSFLTMATDSDGRQESTTGLSDEGASLGVEVLRDLAMREALGLLDADESALFEEAFGEMTPDDQAAMLDLQAAVAREIAGGGTEEPDRSLRYKVLARLTEEMASDASAAGPIAVIGSASSIGRRSRPVSANPRTDAVSELQFERVSRSAAVWRAASFALGAAAVALSVLHFQGQAVSNQLLQQKADSVIAERLAGLFGEDVDLGRFLYSGTAVVSALAALPEADGSAGFLLRESRANSAGEMPALLLGFQFPPSVVDVEVVAVRRDGSGEVVLDRFNVTGRSTYAALPLELGGIDIANVILEVRDADTGRTLMRTAVASA